MVRKGLKAHGSRFFLFLLLCGTVPDVVNNFVGGIGQGVNRECFCLQGKTVPFAAYTHRQFVRLLNKPFAAGKVKEGRHRQTEIQPLCGYRFERNAHLFVPAETVGCVGGGNFLCTAAACGGQGK